MKRLTILTLAALLCACGDHSASNLPVESASQASTPAVKMRNAMDISERELVGRFNQFASTISGGKNLIQGAGETIENQKFSTTQWKIPLGSISIEKNKDNKPFSLALIAGAENQAQQMEIVGLIVSVSAAVFGKGPQAGALVKTCASAADAKSGHVEITVGQFAVYCTSIQGAWMAGISVADDVTLANGLATVPMSQDQDQN
jgi:hypothetical protein